MRGIEMPLLGLLCRSRRGETLAQFLALARQRLLPRPAECQRILRNLVGDHATRSNVGARADGDRGHQRGVGADEGALADIGEELGIAVVIAGDRACADIGAGADAGIADIGQVVDLGALLDDRFLDLAEITDLGLFVQFGTRPNASESSGTSSVITLPEAM